MTSTAEEYLEQLKTVALLAGRLTVILDDTYRVRTSGETLALARATVAEINDALGVTYHQDYDRDITIGQEHAS